MVSSRRTSLPGIQSFPQTSGGVSTQSLLEQLERLRRRQIAQTGATEAERLTEERVVPRPFAQSTRPYSVFDAIKDTSTLDMSQRIWPEVQEPKLPPYEGNFLERSEQFFKDLWQGFDAVDVVRRDERTGEAKYFPGLEQEQKQEFFRAGNALFSPIKKALDGWTAVDAASSLGLAALLHTNPVTKTIANSPVLGWKFGDDTWGGYGIGPFKANYSTEAIEKAQQIIGEEISQLGGGLVGVQGMPDDGGVFDRLLALHQEQPAGTKLFQEMTALSNIGGAGAGGRGVARVLSPKQQALATIRQGIVQTGEIPTPSQIAETPAIKDLAYELLISPKNRVWLERKNWVTLPGTNLAVPAVVNRTANFAVRHLNPNGIADPEDPAHLIMLGASLKDDLIGDSVMLTSQWFLKEGDPRDLFKLDEQMRSTSIRNPDGTAAHFFEIAGQRGRRYGNQLNPAQTRWLENTDKLFKNMREYLVNTGVKNPEFADIALDDADYFPQLWNMLDDIRLTRGKTAVGRGRILTGGKQFWENTRTYTDAADALKEGFWTDYGDPMQAVNTLLRSMYSSAYDHQLVKLLKPYGKTMAERFSPKYVKAQRFANGEVAAMKEIRQFIGKVRHARGPARMVTRRIARGDIARLHPNAQYVLQFTTQRTYKVVCDSPCMVYRPNGDLVPTSQKGFRKESAAWQAAENDLFKAVRDGDAWVPDDVRQWVDAVTNQDVMRSQWRGRKVAYSYSAELAQRADEASLLRGKERRDAFNALQKDLNEASSKANLRKNSIDRAVRDAAAAKGYIGEVQFPGSALSGQIFTPTEIAERVFKERAIADPQMFAQMKFLDADQIRDITKEIRGYPDEVTWSTLWGIPKVATKIASALRTVQAGLDFGVMMIHGLPLLLTNPEGWGRAVGPSFRAMSDRTVMARYITDHWDTVQALARHNMLGGSGSEYIEGLQKSGLINKTLGGVISVGERTGPLGSPLRVAGQLAETGFDKIQTQFDAFLLAGKVEMWEGLEPSFRAAMAAQGLRGVDFPEAELAEHVAKMTGTLNMNNLGISPTLQQVAGGFLMFAPKYRMATYGVMVDAFRGNIRGELARQSLSRMAAGGMAMYLATGLVLRQQPNLDPTSGKFLTYEIGGQSIGVGSAWVSTIRFLANASGQAITDPQQLVRIDSRDSKLNQFMSGQLAPTTRIGKYMIEGKTYFGDPTMDSVGSFMQNVVAQGTLPFWASGLMDTPKGGWAGALGVVPEVGGLRSFPQSRWEHAEYLANVRALEQGETSYDDMSGREKMVFRDLNPDIDQLMEEATLGFVGKGTEEDIRRSEYFSDIRKYTDEEYRPELDDLISVLEGHLRFYDDAESYTYFTSQQDTSYNGNNLQTVEGVRNAIADAGRRLGKFYEAHQNEYPDVLVALDELRRDKVDSAVLEDVAYYDYISTVVLQEFPIKNDAGKIIGYDFGARRDALDAFKARWGNGLYQLVKDRRYMTKDTPPLLQELELGREKHESFFRIDELLMNNKDFGFSTNLELQRAWPEYRRNKGDTKLIEEMYADRPNLLKTLKQFDSGVIAARKLYREQNQDFDAWYYRWGYSDTMMHPDNDDIWQVKGAPIWFHQQAP